MTTAVASDVAGRLGAAKRASRSIGLLDDAAKTLLLDGIADALIADTARIVTANRDDLERGEADGISAGLRDRLMLDEARVASLARAVRDVARLPDPVGRVLDERELPGGVRLQKVSVPFGVVASIYEARPNVTVDITALALRSGNAVVLRGGSAAQSTNAALIEAMRGALQRAGVDLDSIQTVDDFGRDGARALMRPGASSTSWFLAAVPSSSRPSLPSRRCRSSRPEPGSSTSSSTSPLRSSGRARSS